MFTYEQWLRHCNNMKQRIEHELVNSKKLRETMYIPRDKTKNDLRTQNDNVNFGLRRRIYDTERIKNELEWQKQNVGDSHKHILDMLLCSVIFTFEGVRIRRKQTCRREGPHITVLETFKYNIQNKTLL